MTRLVTAGRRQPLGNLTLIVELELRLAKHLLIGGCVQTIPFIFTREYWAYPQNVSRYLARV
eukprot:5879714-Pyramimonas_sp.AAC.1